MRCPKCGTVIPDDSVICPVCGAALQKKDKESILDKIRFHGIGFDEPNEDEEYFDEEDEEPFSDEDNVKFFDEDDEEEYFDEDDSGEYYDKDDSVGDIDRGDEVIEDSFETAMDLQNENIIDGTADEIEEDDKTISRAAKRDQSSASGRKAASARTEGRDKKEESEQERINPPKRKNRNKKSSPSGLLRNRKFQIFIGAAAAALVIIIAVVSLIVMRPERNSPYLGTWQIASLTKEDKESTVDEIQDADTDGTAYPVLESFSLVLQETGKCTMSVQGVMEKGTWKHNDSGLTLTDDRGNQVTLTDAGDGTLTMDMASFSEDGAGVTVKLVKQESGAQVSTTSLSVSSSSQSVRTSAGAQSSISSDSASQTSSSSGV